MSSTSENQPLWRPTLRACARFFVGLPDIAVVAVEDQPGRPIRVHVETVVEVEGCAGCGTRAWVKDRPLAELVDLPAFGRRAVLVWRKRRRTLHRWHDQIVAWHQARVSNGPTEAANNLIKRIKRIAFGFRRFAHYRLRVLLYAGRPNWNLLSSVDPAEIR